MYAARDLTSLKVGFFVNCVGPWVTSFVGVFIGTMGVVMGVPSDVPSPFTAIVEQVMVLGKHTQNCYCEHSQRFVYEIRAVFCI